MKLFVTLAGLLAAAQAEAFYGYGYGLHQQNWPTAYGPGFERTIWGARGKRDADADADAFYGYGGLGLGSGGFIRQSRVHPGYGGYAAGGFAHLVGKRSADAWGYGYGYPYGRALGAAGVHPTGVSYSNRSPQGLGKRDAEAHYGYGYAPLIGRGVAIHPGFATSYTQRSPQGLHKRDADADAFGLGAGGYIRQARPYAAFGIHHNGYGAFAHGVGKRDADADAAIGFSNRSPQGAYGLGYGYGYGLGHYGYGKRSADAFSYTQRSPQGAYGLGYGYGRRGYYLG